MPAAAFGTSNPRRPNVQLLPTKPREGTGIRMSYSADQVPDPDRILSSSRSARQPGASTEIAGFRVVLRQASAVPARICGSARSSSFSAAGMSFSYKLAAVSSSLIEHPLLVDNIPVIRTPRHVMQRYTRLVSPFTSTQLTGQRPRYFGSSDPWRFRHPAGGKSSRGSRIRRR